MAEVSEISMSSLALEPAMADDWALPPPKASKKRGIKDSFPVTRPKERIPERCESTAPKLRLLL